MLPSSVYFLPWGTVPKHNQQRTSVIPFIFCTKVFCFLKEKHGKSYIADYREELSFFHKEIPIINMQIYTATVLNGSAFFNYIEIFTDYYGLMQLGLKIRQHCTNLIDNAHQSELLLASFYFSFPFWAS